MGLQRSAAWSEVARRLADAIGRPVRYVRPSLIGFFRHARAAGAPAGLAAVMASIGIVARLGYARGVDSDLPRILDRPARSFAEFARDYRESWMSTVAA